MECGVSHVCERGRRNGRESWDMKSGAGLPSLSREPGLSDSGDRKASMDGDCNLIESRVNACR